MRSSFALLSILAATVYAQGTPIAATTVAPASTEITCGACFIVAGVAQVIFADFAQTATASAVVSTGRNGSVVSTTIFEPAQPFTFDSSGLLDGTTVAGSYIAITGTTLEISGATLTSPTAYNVFTAYTSYTETLSGSSCVTIAGTTVTSFRASSYEITDGAPPASQVLSAENAFISAIDLANCAPGTVIVSSTIPFSVTTTTTTSTQAPLSRPSSLPETTGAAPSVAAPTSAAAAATTTTIITNGTAAGTSTSTSIVLLTPTASIIMGGGSTFHPRTISASLVSALLLIPGIAAWML